MQSRQVAAAVVMWVVLSAGAAARQGSDGQASPPPRTPAEAAAIIDRLAPSLVRVEFTAQYDRGESPGDDRLAAWRAYASQAGDDLGTGGWESWEQLIREERPAERGGYLITPTRVYTSDPGLHPRFIKSISVRFGQRVVSARPAAWPRTQEGIFLELEAPIEGTSPLAFDPGRPGPYSGVSYEKRDATWLTRIGGLRGGAAVAEDGRRFTPGNAGALIIDRDGVPVALSGSGDFPVDGSWKQAAGDWPVVDMTEMNQALSRLEADAARNLLRITLNFRSPRAAGDAGSRYRGGGGEDAAITEWNGLGVLTDPGTVLVLASMTPKVTGRLERIRVYALDGRETRATFVGTLREWGGFVARLDSPMSADGGGAARFSTSPITQRRNELLLKAAVTVRGDTRTAYFSHDRIDSFFTSWKGRTFPQSDPGGDGGSAGARRARRGEGGDYLNFLYSLDSEMVAMPIQHRDKVTARERYGADPLLLVPVDIIAAALSEGASAFEPENRPLSEEEENRLAWLGVEMQSMDADLARANDVMDQTNGGNSGGIVTYLYPNSPAAQAGIREGDIILRLHVTGHPRPLEVDIEEAPGIGMMEQFWAAIDRVPEEYLDRLPRPWGSAENSLSRTLTDLGFGTPFIADVWRDGNMIQVPMTVTQGPAHYDAAARFKSEALGVTVRDLTYEVRRYLQLKDDEPGVILSRVDRGSKAAVAGLKPYETIRSVNDEPVNNVKDFERLIGAGGELKFAVKRMTQGRTVKIKLDAKAEAGAGEGGRPPADAGGEKPAATSVTDP